MGNETVIITEKQPIIASIVEGENIGIVVGASQLIEAVVDTGEEINITFTNPMLGIPGAAGTSGSSGTSITNNVVNVSGEYQVLETDDTVVCDSDDDFEVILPIGAIGKILNIKNRGLGEVTVVCLDSSTIEDESSQTIYQGDCMSIQYTAINVWEII